MPSPEKPRIGVVLLNWRENEVTATCLARLRQQRGVVLRIVLVENECEGRSRFADQVEVIANEKNLGFCRGVNQGLERLLPEDHDALLLVNNDVHLTDPLTLRKLYTRMLTTPRCGAVSPKPVFADQPRVQMCAWGRRVPLMGADWVGRGERASRFNETRSVEMLNACCLLVHPECVRDVGLWDETYFIYYDDMDWTYRAYRKGWHMVFEPSVEVPHHGGFTMQKRAEMAQYMLDRGRVVFMRRHASLHEWPLFLFGFLLTLVKPGFRDLIRFRKPDLSIGRFRAFRDGCRLPLEPIPSGRFS